MQLPNHNNYSLAHFRSRTHSLALHYQLAGHLGQRHSDHPVHLRSVGLAARLRWIAERLFGLLYVLTGCEECCLYVVSPVKSTQASKPRLHTAKTRLRTAYAASAVTDIYGTYFYLPILALVTVRASQNLEIRSGKPFRI